MDNSDNNQPQPLNPPTATPGKPKVETTISSDLLKAEIESIHADADKNPVEKTKQVPSEIDDLLNQPQTMPQDPQSKLPNTDQPDIPPPLESQPQPKDEQTSTTDTNQPPEPTSKSKISGKQVATGLVALIFVTGIGVGGYLTSQSQYIQPKASEPNEDETQSQTQSTTFETITFSDEDTWNVTDEPSTPPVQIAQYLNAAQAKDPQTIAFWIPGTGIGVVIPGNSEFMQSARSQGINSFSVKPDSRSEIVQSILSPLQQLTQEPQTLKAISFNPQTGQIGKNINQFSPTDSSLPFIILELSNFTNLNLITSTINNTLVSSIATGYNLDTAFSRQVSENLLKVSIHTRTQNFSSQNLSNIFISAAGFALSENEVQELTTQTNIISTN